jgi:SAM-dependent methyltransferase
MTDTTSMMRKHYGATDLTDRIKSALATIGPEDQPLTVVQLAPLDQFHTRGILATTELAGAAGLEPASRVLDLGCGIGGPARCLAATFGCAVTGVDLSPSFIDAANYLTERCGLSDRVRFQVGDAMRLPFETGSFDCAFLQQQPTPFEQWRKAMSIWKEVKLWARALWAGLEAAEAGSYGLMGDRIVGLDGRSGQLEQRRPGAPSSETAIDARLALRHGPFPDSK